MVSGHSLEVVSNLCVLKKIRVGVTTEPLESEGKDTMGI